jgi:hypothetical protein
MFSGKKLNAYINVQNNVGGADFEKQWFESAIMVLNQIQAGMHNPVATHAKLIEVRDGLQWIQENLNERLNSQHRTMLKSIYSVNIQVINGVIETKNTDYLSIVISTLKTIMEPYYKKQGQEPSPS